MYFLFYHDTDFVNYRSYFSCTEMENVDEILYDEKMGLM